MANLKQIKWKIKSIWNLQKITRALEVVSTIKLQKTKDKADSLKKYLVDLLLIMHTVWEHTDIFKSKNSNAKKDLVIVITSERWLCWSMNAKLFRQLNIDYKDSKDTTDFFVIWKKWLDFCSRSGYNVVWSINLKDDFSDSDLIALYEYITLALQHHEFKSVKVLFNYFKNSLIQIPTNMQIFPMTKNIFEDFACQTWVDCKISLSLWSKDLVIEPNIHDFVQEIHRQIRSFIIQSAIIQNKAWEHAARMIAMKNAKDNSKTIINSLTLSFNKARQASITQEISEIVSAKLALEW